MGFLSNVFNNIGSAAGNIGNTVSGWFGGGQDKRDQQQQQQQQAAATPVAQLNGREYNPLTSNPIPQNNPAPKKLLNIQSLNGQLAPVSPQPKPQPQPNPQPTPPPMQLQTLPAKSPLNMANPFNQLQPIPQQATSPDFQRNPQQGFSNPLSGIGNGISNWFNSNARAEIPTIPGMGDQFVKDHPFINAPIDALRMAPNMALGLGNSVIGHGVIDTGIDLLHNELNTVNGKTLTPYANLKSGVTKLGYQGGALLNPETVDQYGIKQSPVEALANLGDALLPIANAWGGGKAAAAGGEALSLADQTLPQLWKSGAIKAGAVTGAKIGGAASAAGSLANSYDAPDVGTQLANAAGSGVTGAAAGALIGGAMVPAIPAVGRLARAAMNRFGISNPAKAVAEGIESVSPVQDAYAATGAPTSPSALQVPTTVGDIAQQAKTQGGVRLPDSAFNADLRTNSMPAVDNLDVPTFLRQNSQQIQSDSAAKIAAIDKQIDTIKQGSNPQIQKFQDDQAIANAYKESPAKGQAMAKIVSTRDQRVDPAGDIQALMKQRADAVSAANAARSAEQAQGVLNANGLNPAEVSSGIKSVNPNQAADAAAPLVKQQADQAAAAVATARPQHQIDLEQIIQGGGSKQDVQKYITSLPLDQQKTALESVSSVLKLLPDETSAKSVAASTQAVADGGLKGAQAKGVITPENLAPTSPVDVPPVVPTTPPVNPAGEAGAAGAANQEAPTAVQRFIDGLKNSKAQSEADAAALGTARASRSKTISEATDGLTGQAQTDARRLAMAGSMNHRGGYTGIGGNDAQSIFDELRLQVQNDPNHVARPYTVENLEESLSRAITGKSLDGKTVGAPTPGQVTRLENYFGADLGSAVKEAVSNSQTLGEKAMAVAGEVASVPKEVMASMDVSATLRQGGVLGSRFPKQAAQAAVEQVKYMANESYFKESMAAIENDPGFDRATGGGLALSGVSAIDKPEEQFVGKVVGKIPGIAMSNRGYTGFLTKLRMDVFNQIVNKYEADGKIMSPKDIESVCTFINTASGRGDLGHFFENHSTTLTTALFSPRLWASRLQMLNPAYYANLTGPARMYALQSAGTFAAEAGTVLGLAKLGGAQVVTDPRNSDFLKIKIGNNRYDILGGFQQNLVFAARELTGESVSSTTGEVNKFATGVTDIGNQNGLLAKSKFGGTDRVKVLTDLIDNKANPIIGAASHIISGKDIGGKPVNVLGELANLVMPLNVSGTIQAANDQGNLSMSDIPGSAKTLAKGFLTNSPDIFGISAQTYGQIPTKYQPASMAKTPLTVPPEVQKILDKNATEAQAKEFASRDVPFYTDKEFNKAVQTNVEKGNFDAAIEGLQSKYDSSAKDKSIPPSDLADQKDAITRLNVAKATKTDPSIIGLYTGSGKDGVSLDEWRNLGDPKSEDYNPDLYQKLYEYDSALANSGVSRNSVSGGKNFYSAKAPAKGRGGGRSAGANGSLIGAIPTLGKISLGGLSAKNTGTAPMPTVAKLTNGNLVSRHAISVTNAR